MSKYNVHINPPEPDDNIINSKKDFNGLLKDYKNVHQPLWVLRNFHKKRRIRRFILLIIIVLFTLYFSSNYFKNEVREKELKEHLKKEQLRNNSE